MNYPDPDRLAMWLNKYHNTFHSLDDSEIKELMRFSTFMTEFSSRMGFLPETGYYHQISARCSSWLNSRQ